MFKSLLMSAAYGWFAGLLVVMIVVTALFGFIMFIALRPIKKDEFGEATPAKKLQRREAELTAQILNKQNDKESKEELIGKLHEVKSAEKLIKELMDEDKAEEEPAKPASKPKVFNASKQNGGVAKPAQKQNAKPSESENADKKD